jgi:hypothetical protein
VRYYYQIPTHQEMLMSDKSFGEVIQPLHCRASASADKTRVALTFQCPDRIPITIMLPMAGAVGLQRNLTQALYILTAKPPAPAEGTAPAEEPASEHAAAEEPAAAE